MNKTVTFLLKSWGFSILVQSFGVWNCHQQQIDSSGNGWMIQGQGTFLIFSQFLNDLDWVHCLDQMFLRQNHFIFSLFWSLSLTVTSFTGRCQSECVTPVHCPKNVSDCLPWVTYFIPLTKYRLGCCFFILNILLTFWNSCRNLVHTVKCSGGVYCN